MNQEADEQNAKGVRCSEMGSRTAQEPRAGRTITGGAERSGRRWRVRCANHWKKGAEFTYKGHTIIIQRESDEENWYITVTEDATGYFAYDGWWRDSADRPIADAVEEALSGSLLIGGGAEHGGEKGESKNGTSSATVKVCDAGERAKHDL